MRNSLRSSLLLLICLALLTILPACCPSTIRVGDKALTCSNVCYAGCPALLEWNGNLSKANVDGYLKDDGDKYKLCSLSRSKCVECLDALKVTHEKF